MNKKEKDIEFSVMTDDKLEHVPKEMKKEILQDAKKQILFQFIGNVALLVIHIVLIHLVALAIIT
jgi:hypothetical protein